MLALVLLYLTSTLLEAALDREHSKPVEKYISGSNKDVDEALRFLRDNDKLTSIVRNKVEIADWNYTSNLTDTNKEIMLATQAEADKFTFETWKNATSFAWKDFKDSNETIYRWFKSLSILGTAALPKDKLKTLHSLVADMQSVYSKAKICGQDNSTVKACDLSLEPDLVEMLKSSKDYDELKNIWVQWRDSTGVKVKPKFLEYVKLLNEAARLNGYVDAGEMWRDRYESDTFQEEVESLWKTVEPFYKQLHAYVRKKLIQLYSNKKIQPNGPIPAHLLGNMWSQKWANIFDIVKPYPNKQFVDVTRSMLRKKIKIVDMFKMSEEFFTSLGLMPMTAEFWNRSIISKPSDREMVCHASAWDFSDGKDFRIKMCAKVNMDDFITVHHEMGHIQYYQQYAHQPAVFRHGANPGFHEAIGDVLALSVATSRHLKKIGFINEVPNDEEMEINNLMNTALNKIVFLPFGYLIDSYRWKVFSGEISEEELNSKWWELRLKYQGLCPPVKRTNDDLDAAAKYHVIANIPYIRYFVSFIIQFQFHKGLCEAAGHEGPLHKCDIYQNKEAGKVLSHALSLGNSVHWTEVMKIITRGKSNKMDAQPLIEYFEPLMNWLKKQNENETLGWKSLDPMICPENA